MTTARSTTTSTTTSTSTSTSTLAPTTSTSLPCIDLGGWSDARLAALTVTVPAEETDVSSAGAEVAAGAGGVVLFGATAPADLASQLASLEAAVPGRIGLLVMTDEEGGGVQRMANLVGSLPWARYMGTNWTPAEITAAVAAVAAKMAAAGVNVDLAPVVDVDGRDVPPGPTDPDGWRSFGGSTSLVTADGVAYLRGLEQGGVIGVLKHFPGLGGATGNTDVGPADTLPWPTLEKVGLPPFVQGIEDGAPAVMVSNAIVPGLTSLPASLSPAAISGELVGTLHFGGLVITDSLSAGAISGAGYTVTAAAVQAMRAGADMVMYTSSTEQATEQQFESIVSAEVSAVGQGTLSRSRLLSAASAVLSVRHLGLCG